MLNIKEFSNRINSILKDIGQEVLAYNEDDYWMISSVYEYLEFYAYQNQLTNMAIALPLARGLHDGKYRKSTMKKNNQVYKVPYYIHPLLVCRMLADLRIPVSKEEEDILLASALCHDIIEDVSFVNGGKELYEDYHLDKRIYEAVKNVSKRYDFTEQQEKDFFQNIAENPISLLVKLSDRGNNVEDLYNMSIWKIHEYVSETNTFFFPMCDYGLEHYPQLRTALFILRDKMLTLTDVAESFVSRYAKQEEILHEELKVLKQENEELRKEWKSLWKGE